MKKIFFVMSLLGSINAAMAMSHISPEFICENERISIEIFSDLAIVHIKGGYSLILDEQIDSSTPSKRFFMDSNDQDVDTVSFRNGIFPQAKYTSYDAVKNDSNKIKMITKSEYKVSCKKNR